MAGEEEYVRKHKERLVEVVNAMGSARFDRGEVGCVRKKKSLERGVFSEKIILERVDE